jgi:F-type H+-transporting ATPase subunit b
MKKLFFWGGLLLLSFGVSAGASAQQPPTSAAPIASGAPAASLPALPPGHPPMDPKRREQLEKMLEERNKKRATPTAGQPPPPPQPPRPMVPLKPKTPLDEHGHCLGQGSNDRPKDINLFHGWLGTKHEIGESSEKWSKAVKEPPRPPGAVPWDWWKWRLTPYPYRYDNHDDHCDPANEPSPLIANIINLAALIFIVVRFGRAPVRQALVDRKKRIMAEFDKAAEIKRSAEVRLEKYEDELEHLDDKLVALRSQYRNEGQREEVRVREEMQEVRARMLGDAEFRISQESKSARDELSREALEAALAAAEKLVKESLTAADHQRIAREYLAQLGPALSGAATRVGSKGGAP